MLILDNDDSWMTESSDTSDEEMHSENSSENGIGEDDGDQSNGWPISSDTEIEEIDLPERREFELSSTNTTNVYCW